MASIQIYLQSVEPKINYVNAKTYFYLKKVIMLKNIADSIINDHT